MSRSRRDSRPVRLGVMVPMSGVVSAYGQEIERAARIAAEMVNLRGGVMGRPIELVVEDDGSTPEVAVPAAESLIRAGCVALIGNLMSNARIAVSERVTAQRHVPLLNFSFYEGSIYDRFFFNFGALPNQQIDRMIPFMVRLAGPKMYFAGNNYEWPRGSIDAARKSLVAAGGEVIAEEYLALGISAEDAAALAARVDASGADIFVPYFAGDDQVEMLRACAAAGVTARKTIVTGHFDAVIAQSLTPEERDGVYTSNTYFMTVATALNAQLLESLAAYPDVTGIWPGGNGVVTNFGEGAFLCVLAFARAARLAGSVAPDALVDALAHTVVDSAQGRVVMDAATHHAAVNTFLARCDREGVLTVVTEFGQVPPVVPERYRALFPQEQVSDAVQVVPSPADRDDRDVAAKALAVASAAVVVALADGTVVLANEAAERLYGYVHGSMSGRSVLMLFPPADRAHCAALLVAHAGTEGDAVLQEMTG